MHCFTLVGFLSNRIEQFLGIKPAYGVFADDLQLSPVTTHGIWKIEVKQLVS